MQALRTSVPPTIFETFPRAIASASRATAASVNSTSPPSTRAFRSSPTMSSNPTFQQYKIQTTSFPTAPGVSLSQPQQIITGSILDLFIGKPSLRKLSLWTDTAVFTDPLTIAEGRAQYAPQWYGLQQAFSNIERLGGQITSSGNPIELDLKTRYTVKGLGSAQTVDSKVKIWTEGEGESMRVKRVEDRWDDSLPDSTFKNAMRNLNSVVVPK